MAHTKPTTYKTEVSSDESLFAAIVRGLASASGTSADSLPSLQYSIDTDAVETVFSPRKSASSLSFFHHGFEITVDADSPDPSTVTVTYEEMASSDEQFR